MYSGDGALIIYPPQAVQTNEPWLGFASNIADRIAFEKSENHLPPGMMWIPVQNVPEWASVVIPVIIQRRKDL